MPQRLMRIGLIVVFVTLLLGTSAICVDAANDPQANPQKCQGSKPDQCDGRCVNLQSDKQNCGSCGNICKDGEVCQKGVCSGPNNNKGIISSNKVISINKKNICTDGVKNGQETDIDCGGATCPACADGKTCKNGTDCKSGICAVGSCQAPSCVDGVMNGGETGVDCGGPCKPCPTKATFTGNFTTAPGRTLKPISGIGNISAGPAQNAQGTPSSNPLTTPSYLFVLDNCLVDIARSPSTDDDYAGFGVSVNNQIVGVTHKYIGGLSRGDNPSIDLEIGPVPIPNDPNIPVVIGYLIVNRGFVADESPITMYGAIDLATKDLLNNYVSSWALLFVDNYLGYLYNSHCDGAVAAAYIPTNGNELAQIAPGKSYSKFDVDGGTNSAIGCGPNSEYSVDWHVERVS